LAHAFTTRTDDHTYCVWVGRASDPRDTWVLLATCETPLRVSYIAEAVNPYKVVEARIGMLCL
jgi:hypothetical protein